MITVKITKNMMGLMAILLFSACAPNEQFPSIDESGSETATVADPTPSTSDATGENQTPGALPTVDVPTSSDDSNQTSTAPAAAAQRLILSQAMVLRYEKNGVLESVVELPEGTQIEIPQSYEVKHLDFRNSSGGVERSSTGFIYPVQVVSVSSQYAALFPQNKIDSINSTKNGLYIFASIVGSLEGISGNFAAIVKATPGLGFLKYYEPSGKPKFKYTNSVAKRFGARLNKGIALSSLSTADQSKWQRIYGELKKAVNREVETSKSYLMMDKDKAVQLSINFEKTGAVSPIGAWSIATQGTAVRHGFSNVPCAEFQSELLRQAYQRAGYRSTDDFNSKKGNQLIWSNSAAVVNFSMALYKAGWIPWDSTLYRPIVGAFLMNGSGLTPGHTYISAGDDGMIIVDNGAPQGRDLRKTTDKTISIMFQTGVFFLPPGINPPAW